MAIRHRTPTIFSIYMLDVICCALGCVILLWQVSHQEAEKQTAAAVSRADDLRASLDREKNANRAVHALSGENDQLKTLLDAARQLADARGKDNLDLQTKSNLTAAELAETVKANAALLIRLAEMQKLNTSLEFDLKETTKKFGDQGLKFADLEKLAAALGKEKIDLIAKLQTSDLRVRILESDLEKLLGEKNDGQKTLADALRDRDTSNLKLSITKKELDLLQTAVEKLTADNIMALRKAKTLQSLAENRFAGITLTGRKVIFMVDMSGSMELADEATADPDKWPLVCETIGKILKSLNDVTHFQVILFSDKVSYPLAMNGKWIEVTDRAEEAVKVVEKLKSIKPYGPTNMNDAFQETFRFRDQGLDTIYVISDGLPNIGPGRPPGLNNTDVQAITTALAKHVRDKVKNDWNRALPNSPRVRINTVGFFYESPDVGAFLWALARENDGSFVGVR